MWGVDRVSHRSNSIAVRLEGIVVRYPYEKNRATSLKEYSVRKIKKDIRTSYLVALDGLSAEIYKGETFGVVGRNGAGKSTLLKVISKIIHPTTGRLQVWGSLASLLGIGAGFHPELSGKENIYLYSALLGRSQSFTERHFDEIVDFAELENFIDSPIRTYSTGMVARLGFAVAMADRPDILLVDEVLAVGDELFQAKCRDRFRSFKEKGTTIIIVSHGLGQVGQICQRVMWLHRGNVMAIGEPLDVLDRYRGFSQEEQSLVNLGSESP
jgi:ABC-type polysaccharide/polyol phosphate transport system ATPase subunit